MGIAFCLVGQSNVGKTAILYRLYQYLLYSIQMSELRDDKEIWLQSLGLILPQKQGGLNYRTFRPDFMNAEKEIRFRMAGTIRPEILEIKSPLSKETIRIISPGGGEGGTAFRNLEVYLNNARTKKIGVVSNKEWEFEESLQFLIKIREDYAGFILRYILLHKYDGIFTEEMRKKHTAKLKSTFRIRRGPSVIPTSVIDTGGSLDLLLGMFFGKRSLLRKHLTKDFLAITSNVKHLESYNALVEKAGKEIIERSEKNE